MPKLLEKAFRRSAMWAYALNQSRAKVVMDPIYLVIAKRLLRGTTGPSAKLLTERFPQNLYFPYRAQSRKLAYDKRIDIDEWAKALIGMQGGRRRDVNARA